MTQPIMLKSVRLWERLIRLLYPATCMVCDSILREDSELYLCDNCKRLMPRYSRGFEKIPELPYIEKLLAAFHYEEGVDKAIHKMKFNDQPRLSKTFGWLLYEELAKESCLPDFDYVIPVPMFQKKRKRRGYNQSELIAKALAPYLQVPVLGDCLVKTRQTKPQSSLKREERLKNLDGAFAIKSGEQIYGKNILLVDDVLTTGTTLNLCAKILYESGASWVFGTVLAIAGK
ncbi:MAG: ComF family protein [Clostridia bacterium]|nr:ComF family protein [Clostridia bacterium]